MNEKLSDEHLVEGFCNTGERQFYELLYKRYAQKTLHKAMTYVRVLEDAEDIVQNAWVKIFFNLSKFQGRSSVSTWIYRITVNESISHLRKRRTYSLEELMEEDGVQLEDAFADFARTLEQASVLSDAMASVSPDVRSLLLLKFGEGYTYEEIAEQTGLGESAIKMKLSRAKKQIQENLTELDQQEVTPQNSQ